MRFAHLAFELDPLAPDLEEYARLLLMQRRL